MVGIRIIGYIWWERSASPNGSTGFLRVGSNGDPSYYNRATSSYCICPDFLLLTFVPDTPQRMQRGVFLFLSRIVCFESQFISVGPLVFSGAFFGGSEHLGLRGVFGRRVV